MVLEKCGSNGKTEGLLDKSPRVDLLANRITLLIVELTAR